MAINKKFLQEVFDKQPGNFIAVSRKLNGHWTDKYFTELDPAISWLNKQPTNADLYFCPTKLDKPRRVKQNVIASKFLYADLDFVSPYTMKSNLKPSHAWESSPGRYQCLWELPKPVDANTVERANKGLAYNLGADKGGWDLTQVLRIPGCTNNKYPSKPVVKLLWTDRSLVRSVDNYPLFGESSNDKPIEVSAEEFTRLLKKWKPSLSGKLLGYLRAVRSEKGKRSDVLWYLSHALIKAGIPKEEALALIRGSVWNKYRGRADEIKRLTHEIDEALKSEGPTKSEGSDTLVTRSLEVITHQELMYKTASSPGWLVDSFWTQSSHGIIAGEPKSFKSTLLMDFVISLASGEPFLGQFEVRKTGPVLVVQNENADWIMQDRIRKISAARSIAGSMTKHGNKIVFKPPTPLPIYYINQQGFSFEDPTHREQVDKFVQEYQPIAVIFDPLYLMFSGDLNQSNEVTKALSWLLYLKQEYDTSVILVHHWNKNSQVKRGGQRMLGSTILHGWIESAWYLSVNTGEEEQEEDDDIAKQAANVSLTMEREFRGAGTFPKVDIQVHMKPFGEMGYDVKIEKHQSKGRPAKIPRHELFEAIANAVDRIGGTSDISEITRMVREKFPSVDESKIREVLRKREKKVD